VGGAQGVDYLGFAELLGRHEGVFETTGAKAGEGVADIGCGGMGVDRRGAPVVGLGGNRIELIPLQREEWADDDGGSGEEQSGGLVDCRLTGPRGLDHERVAASEDRLDRFELLRPEFG
jgi:hypothetical protein